MRSRKESRLSKAMSNGENGHESVLVVGGGIAGIQASLDLANMGFKVYLVEKSPSIGGRMAQLDKTFPTNDCAMCILAPKMIESNSHPNIDLLTYSEVEKVSGGIGKFKVKVKKKASFIDWSKCTGCNECAKVCPVELNSEFNQNIGSRKAIYIPFPQAIPNKYTIDKRGYPPCRFACPAGVNAQGYVALIAQGKFKEALEVVRRTMPFAGVLGRVCTHPCELDCERGKFDESISIRALKRFVADHEMKAGREKLTPIKKTKKEKVAVIGSGPAGLACAYDLIREGYAVTVFEALAEAGGLLRYGIPEYRLPKEAVDNDISYIQELGVEIKTNSPVKDFGEVFNQGYSAIFVGTGAWASQKMGIPGEESKGVIHALDFLRMVNSGVEMKLGSGVAVIGGGNAAIDAARASLRLGAKEVTVVYRRSEAEMPAIKTEIEEAEREGIKFHFLAAPVKILSKNGQLSALECIKMKLGEPDASGRRRPVPIKGSEFTMDVDNSIIAIGQSVDKEMLPKDLGYTGWGTLEVDPITLQTNLDGVFAGGDIVSGPADVVVAVAAGKEAAISIDRYLRGVSLTEERKITPKRVESVSKEGIQPAARSAMPMLKTSERKGSFAEVEQGYDEKTAIEEAKRCLNCGVCSECRECEKVCEAKAIDYEMEDKYLELNVGAIIVASGLGLYDISSLTEYGYGKIKNVITAMEFERLTAASGPTMGALKRPSDGRIPENIAFIQCVGSRDFRNKSYCSSVCCMHATKEAMLAYEHHPGTKSTIFYMDMRAVGKRFQEYIARAKKEYNVTYIRGRPGRIEVNPKNDNPIIWYEETTSGEVKSFEAELVVLAQAMVPQITQDLSKILGIELDENGFVKIPDKLVQPLDTTKPGIFACGYVHSPRDIPDSVTQASGAAGRAAEAIAGGN
jgi:heterodisulfide reductase subunit A